MFEHLAQEYLEQITESFFRYRKALQFWSLGISLYLQLLNCFLSFVSFVLRNLCSGTNRRNQVYPVNLGDGNECKSF